MHGLTREQLAKEPKFAEIARGVPGIRARRGADHPQRAVRRRVPERRIRAACPAVRAQGRRSVPGARYAWRWRARCIPGQRNSLDALCKRYSVDNSHRDYHGALLDARILAEVYLAMTGGQATFFAERGIRAARSRRPRGRRAARRAPACASRWSKPSEEEFAAHEHALALLDKASGGNTVWRKLAAGG